jgi:hypothetical protein
MKNISDLTITVVATYTDEGWEVLEEQGEEEVLAEFREDIGAALEMEEPWSDRDRFMNALSENPVFPGVTVFARMHIEDRTWSGPEGTEYDYAWIHDEFAVYISKDIAKAIAIQACERVISRGGYCPNCYHYLKGTTWYARKHGVCDRCAQRLWETDINLARDPLWLKRQRARNAAKTADVNRKWIEKQINEASTAEELDEIARECDREYQNWLATWRMMQ